VDTDAASCAAIGPGVHPASFWYRDVVGYQVSLDATFYSGTDCTGSVGWDSLDGSPGGGGWQQLAGVVAAPAGTHSVLFSLSVGTYCSDSCSLSANFDDVSVDDAVTTTPFVKSFSPVSGWFGLSVSISGDNFTGATSVTFNGTEAQFSIQSDQSITADVPQGATTGPISVTTANGTAWSSSSFTLVPPPTISSFTPTSGQAGTSVDIHGSNFTGAGEVTFNGYPATDFTVDSDSEIHATVPKSATTGPISVTAGNSTGYSASPFTVPIPTISSFTPTSGPVGTSVDIHGSNLSLVTWVEFNGGPYAQFTIDSDTEIHATVPCGSWPGPIDLGTASGYGSSSSSSFTVTAPAPSISSFSPTSGPVGGTVDIRGSNLCGAIPNFNGTLANGWTVGSDSEIQAWVRDGSTTGPISVTTPGGTTTSSTVFTVAGPPTVSSFTPTSGPVGTSVDIQGTNFTGTTGVKFNGTSDPSFIVNSPTDITAHVPAGATSGPVSVTTPGGTATSSGSFAVIPPPSISSFTPTSGPVGTTVTITGTNFTGATSVKFNGSAASYTVNSPTSITATVSSGATTGPISVTTPSGTATSSSAFTVTPPPPRITGFSPTAGRADQQVAITGSDFTGATGVRLGTASAKFTVNSPTRITATVPTIPHGTYQWSVTTPSGTGTSTGSFHVT
jgi:hypothetical protein